MALPLAILGAGMLLAQPALGAERSRTVEVRGWCYGDGTDADYYRVALPPRAVNIRAIPQPGAVLVGSDGETTARVARVLGTRNGSRAVRWLVEEQDCVPGRRWSVGPQTFTVRFRVLPPPIFAPKDCTKPRQRPSRIVLACGDFYMYVHKLRWRTWGGRKARGRGVLRANSCVPSCAESRRWDQFKVRVRLEKVRKRRCGGRQVHLYRRMVLSFPNQRPSYHKRIRTNHLWCAP